MTKQIEQIWSILSDGVIIDHLTNNVSFFNVIEQVRISKSMVEQIRAQTKEKTIQIPAKLSLTLLFRKTGSSSVDTKGVVELRDPKGIIVGKMDVQVSIPADKDRARIISQLPAIGVNDEGIYSFVFLVADDKGLMQEVSSLPLQVEFA